MVSKNTSEPNLGLKSAITSPTLSSTPTSNEYKKIITASPVSSPTGSCNNSTSGISPGGDSKIPRPSPTALRRSSSMRLRGERGYNCNFRTTSSSSPASNPIKQYHQRHNLQSLQHQNDLFPAITENGVDSPRHRTLSLSLTPARPRSRNAVGETSSSSLIGDDSDVESVKSYGSACSTASACDHAHFALNGTTWSGRSRKYVVHCSNNTNDPEYLTPTQRSSRQIRRLQIQLNDAKKLIDDKDAELVKLTQEVVELRLYKASLNSPDDKTDSSDALTVRENNQLSPETPSYDLPNENNIINDNNNIITQTINNELAISLADSGHFDDDTNNNNKDLDLKNNIHHVDHDLSIFKNVFIQTDMTNIDLDKLIDDVKKEIVENYESRIDEMQRAHIDELQDLKQKHNDKVESLLNQLSEINTQLLSIRPSMDSADAKIIELEKQLEKTKAELIEQKTMMDEQEERNKQMYLKMYSKGQEAARLEAADQIFEHASTNPPKVTVAQLMQQLSVTQIELENIKAMYRRIVESRNQGTLDPEITLQFLKSAIYYFLTDKENHHGHLNAIESILGFTDNEKLNIEKVYGNRK
ncbi:rho GTPase-activating protein gacZ isoform X2 [Aphidius gifuensis]|uniref:rho GTPase-activating protein gacZ isoform X2 n=1 Tax=Aphidius gifuensis TaxID=684658 RepID=UPI001CDBD918|nr:rho GTPase-activating protein gacZ isoform X2 [Aphidius gifuensis]